jgi:hypothetical protein
MAETKTRFTGASVEEYLEARGSEAQRADCRELIARLERITGQPPRMFGPSIVGFGSYRYTYATGHSGEAPLAGFAIRGREIVIYLMCEEGELRAQLSRLGPHRMTKCCLYVKRLADLDRTVLEELIVASIAGAGTATGCETEAAPVRPPASSGESRKGARSPAPAGRAGKRRAPGSGRRSRGG